MISFIIYNQKKKLQVLIFITFFWIWYLLGADFAYLYIKFPLLHYDWLRSLKVRIGLII